MYIFCLKTGKGVHCNTSESNSNRNSMSHYGNKKQKKKTDKLTGQRLCKAFIAFL